MTERMRIESDSRERVAYDLAILISKHETQVDTKDRNREYWLKLYQQSFEAVKGRQAEAVMKR